ncbi:MAG: prepilin-type N-terminal cleavage/methylation domain-containing protein, partial [Verrucomicrobiota bacterium]
VLSGASFTVQTSRSMNQKVKQKPNRQGLTLVELLVVLTILTAVASIIIPILPDTNQLSNSSTGSANMREVIKVVETFRSETGNYSNSWDSLIDAGGDVLPTGVISADVDLEILNLDSAAVGSDEDIILNALTNANITESLQHIDFADTTVNQTFDGLNGTNELGTNDNIAVLTDGSTAGDDGEARLGLNPSGGEIVRYIAFGLGQNSTMVGRAMADAPVKFLRGGENPVTQYARWIVIFAVFDDESLRLSTVAGLEEDQLRGINFHLDGFYDSF